MRVTTPALAALTVCTLLASACGVFLYVELFGSGFPDLFNSTSRESTETHKQLIFYFPLTSR